MRTRTEPETVEGVSWAIVVLVELGVPQAKALTRELESAQIIVLVEGSMLRAAMLVTEQRPHLMVLPASLPLERTQVLRDTAKETGTEVMLVDANGDTGEIVEDARAAVARVMKARPQRR